MFGSLGMPELVFILLLALLVFGPKRLPEVGKTIGRGLREFRRATNDLKRTVETEISTAEMQTPRPAKEPSPAAPAAAEPAPEPMMENRSLPAANPESAAGPSSDTEPSGRIDSESAAAPEPARPADGVADSAAESAAGTDAEPAGEV